MVNVRESAVVKSVVQKFLRKTVGAPAVWFGLAALAIVAGLGLSYHRSQVEADFAMALRLGPPEAVAIEAADPAHFGEVNVIARFDPKSAIIVKIGTAGERTERLAVPLFAAGSDLTSSDGTGEELRPLREAKGLAVVPMGALDQIAPGNEVFEGALNGPTLPVDAFALDTAAVLAEAGISLPAQFVAVRPWLPGRTEALAPAPASELSGYLIWAGIALAAFGFGLSLRPGEEHDEGRILHVAPPKMREKQVTKSRIMADTDRFNPLIGQDDIRRGAMERLAATEKAQGRTPSTFFTSGPSSKVGGAWVKNRR
ncbi:MAG: hypothetical protein AAGM21_02720 [Pseudomonadota bacterium]